jgi:hypothetical protein
MRVIFYSGKFFSVGPRGLRGPYGVLVSLLNPKEAYETPHTLYQIVLYNYPSDLKAFG